MSCFSRVRDFHVRIDVTPADVCRHFDCLSLFAAESIYASDAATPLRVTKCRDAGVDASAALREW